MTCVMCRHGTTRAATATLTVERGSAVLVFKRVPADVCQDCGEAYLDEETTEDVLRAAEEAVRDGVQVAVKEYVVASDRAGRRTMGRSV